MKTVDTISFLDTICELTQKGQTVSIPVSGSSMVPFLSGNRDYVFLQKPNGKLRKGDIVLYNRQNGDYVLHRIKKITPRGFYLLGDRQTCLEGPVKKEQLRCVATKAKRKGKLITPKSFCWMFFSKVWIRTVFLRPAFFAVARILHPKHKKR